MQNITSTTFFPLHNRKEDTLMNGGNQTKSAPVDHWLKTTEQFLKISSFVYDSE